MSGFLLTLHVIVSVLLVAVILLQPGAKGGVLGARDQTRPFVPLII